MRELARSAEKARATATAADEQAARSEGELQQRRDEGETSGQAWVAASRQWRQQVREWGRVELPVPAGVQLDWDELEAVLGEGSAEAEELSSARSVGAAVVRPAQERARAGEGAAIAEVAEARRALECGEEERRQLESTSEGRPPRSRFQGAERDANGGAPLYELVEVADSLSADQRSGLEAALEASGLLDAWVGADGLVLHPSTQDVILRGDAPPVPDGAPPSPASSSRSARRSRACCSRWVGVIPDRGLFIPGSLPTAGGPWDRCVARGARTSPSTSAPARADRRGSGAWPS